jgi:hypothetical protein
MVSELESDCLRTRPRPEDIGEMPEGLSRSPWYSGLIYFPDRRASSRFAVAMADAAADAGDMQSSKLEASREACREVTVVAKRVKVSRCGLGEMGPGSRGLVLEDTRRAGLAL